MFNLRGVQVWEVFKDGGRSVCLISENFSTRVKCCDKRTSPQTLDSSNNFAQLVDQVDRTQAYLPGSGESLITKEDPPGRGHSIALRFG